MAKSSTPIPIIISPKSNDSKPIALKVSRGLEHPSTFYDVAKRSEKRLNRIATKLERKGLIKEARAIRTAATKFQDYDTTDPYNSALLNMMEDAILNDGNVQRAIKNLITFTLGAYQTPAIVSRFGDEDAEVGEATTYNGRTIRHEDILGIIRLIERRKSVRFYTSLKGLMKQAYAFGRAALAIDYGPITYNGAEYKDMPVALKPLSTRNLGKVTIDPESWEVEKVQYSDINANAGGRLPTDIEAEDMIYLRHDDDNTKPDSLGYGHSRLLSSIHWSEIVRIAGERDVKEIFMTLWAGVLVAKINTRNNSVAQSIASQLVDAGTVTVTNQDVEIEPLAIEQHLDQLMAALKDISTIIARNIGVPSALMNQEEIQNHATLDGVLQAWEKSVLKDEREWLCEALDAQWYDRILARLFDVKDAEELPIKVTLQFTPVSFLDWTDKIDGVLKLRGPDPMITKERAIKMLELPEEVLLELDEAEQEAEEKRQREMEKFQAEKQMSQQRTVKMQKQE